MLGVGFCALRAAVKVACFGRILIFFARRGVINETKGSETRGRWWDSLLGCLLIFFFFFSLSLVYSSTQLYINDKYYIFYLHHNHIYKNI